VNKPINFIHIQNMVNSSVQQGVPISSDQAEDIKAFLSTIDTKVDLYQIESAIIHNKANAKSLTQRYFNSFLDELKAFKIESFNGPNRDNPWGDQVADMVEKMTPLQIRILEFFKVISEYDSDAINIPELLQQLLHFNFQKFNFHNQTDIAGHQKVDNYRIFVYETVLYLFAYLLREQKYDLLNKILHFNYQVKCVLNENSSQPIISYNSVLFPRFNYPVPSMNHEYRRLHKRVYDETENLYVNFLRERAGKSNFVSIGELKEADLLLYFISLAYTLEETNPHFWIPYFSDDGYFVLDTMLRAVSCDYFEKIKKFFKVNNTEEFIKLIPKIFARQSQHPHFITPFNIPAVTQAFNTNQLFSQQ